jgi:hypothetical protein
VEKVLFTLSKAKAEAEEKSFKPVRLAYSKPIERTGLIERAGLT